MSLFKKFQINFLDIVFFMFSLRIFESLGKSLKPNEIDNDLITCFNAFVHS